MTAEVPTHHLLPGFSLWGIEELHDPPVAGIPALKEAGYATLEVAYYNISPEVVKAVQENGLRLIVQRTTSTVADLVPALEAAKRHGALLVNLHAGTPHMRTQEAADVVNAMIDAADSYSLQLLFETHRGTMTQDLLRTVDLVESVPRMRLTLDVSHYIIAEERPGPVDQLRPLLNTLLPRVQMIHGRISNGEQIQVDAGDGHGELAQLYKKFWCDAMRAWREHRAPGSAFVFTPELGPPIYALTDSKGHELSDRWQQSLVLRRLAEEAWKESARAIVVGT
ncbi:MAG: sugar phosphate isomerase/epimerase family protein [Candidatus Sumerlaeaceae bacterium]